MINGDAKELVPAPTCSNPGPLGAFQVARSGINWWASGSVMMYDIVCDKGVVIVGISRVDLRMRGCDYEACPQ